MKKLKDIIADRLVDRREKAGLTQNQLSKKLNVSRVSISLWESHNNNRIPDIQTIIDISQIYKCDINYLLGLSETTNPDNKSANSITGLSEEALDILLDNKDISGLNDYLIKNGYIRILEKINRLKSLEHEKNENEKALNSLPVNKELKKILFKWPDINSLTSLDSLIGKALRETEDKKRLYDYFNLSENEKDLLPIILSEYIVTHHPSNYEKDISALKYDIGTDFNILINK